MSSKNKIGLALSGGGYRAAVYHIGTFRAIKKMELLEKIDVISSNSGGSITNACYGLYGDNYELFEAKVLDGVQKGVIKRLFFSFRFLIALVYLLFPIVNLIFPFFNTPFWVNLLILGLMILGLMFAQFHILPFNKIIERILNNIFFEKKKLGDLTEKWKTVINASNLDTARVFTFEDSRMSDSKYTNWYASPKVEFSYKCFPVSRAVVASTCVPFAFTPVTIGKGYINYVDSKKDTSPDSKRKINPRLIDGGIYDNQGIHKVTQKNSSCYCENVIVSDAGRGLDMKKKFRNQVTLLSRTSEVFMERIKNVQMVMNLYSEQNNNSVVAYQSLRFDLQDSLVEFIRMLKQNHISPIVTKAHGINQSDIDEGNWDKIELQIKDSIKLDAIIVKGCTEEELVIARGVKTGLSGLSNKKINALIKHAETITELQVKLFLPHLF